MLSKTSRSIYQTVLPRILFNMALSLSMLFPAQQQYFQRTNFMTPKLESQTRPEDKWLLLAAFFIRWRWEQQLPKRTGLR